MLGNKIVVTVMSNLGLHLALKKAGLRLLKPRWGTGRIGENAGNDAVLGRTVRSYNFHRIQHNGRWNCHRLAAVKVMAETGKPLSRLAANGCLPQVLVNVRVRRKREYQSEIKSVISQVP